LKLHEYQSKQLFAERGIPIPRGQVARTPDEARTIALELGGPVVVKSQVLVGGRGKAGGIKVAPSADEAAAAAERILGMTIKGLPVRKVLIDEAADIRQEIYLGAALDRSKRRVVLIASAAGGIEIEEVARETPEKIVRTWIDPFLGLREYQGRDVAAALNLPKPFWKDFIRIAQALYATVVAVDASLAEINPLAVVGRPGEADERLVALDGKIVLDDSALFRHPELAAQRDLDDETPAETQAREAALNYVQLDGTIGCMVNGAGLAMATMDIIKLCGGQPANFLDIAGGAKADKVARALNIILSDDNVHAVLFNIFGGITRCDEVARGILTALEQVPTRVPMVARLVGTNEEEGRRLLADAQMITATSLLEAAQQAVAAAQAGGAESRPA
jgi:succinyl-CoA synthetase beta subunit